MVVTHRPKSFDQQDEEDGMSGSPISKDREDAPSTLPVEGLDITSHPTYDLHVWLFLLTFRSLWTGSSKKAKLTDLHIFLPMASPRVGI